MGLVLGTGLHGKSGDKVVTDPEVTYGWLHVGTVLADV